MKNKVLKVLYLSALVILISCNKKVNIKEDFDINSLKALSDLAVLECSFNNVAKINQPKGIGITHLFEADRKIFMEYEGTIRIGVDIGEVIDKYDNNSKVITIPKAKIISITDNPYTYNNYISKDGIINKNKIEDDSFKKAISESLLKMELLIRNNNQLMNRAQVLAESQIKTFINSFGNFNIRYIRE